MDWPVTLAITVGLTLFAVFCGWRGSRPPDPARGPRMIPYRFLMLLTTVFILGFLIHLLIQVGDLLPKR